MSEKRGHMSADVWRIHSKFTENEAKSTTYLKNGQYLYILCSAIYD